MWLARSVKLSPYHQQSIMRVLSRNLRTRGAYVLRTASVESTSRIGATAVGPGFVLLLFFALFNPRCAVLLSL